MDWLYRLLRVSATNGPQQEVMVAPVRRMTDTVHIMRGSIGRGRSDIIYVKLNQYTVCA
jgi:hypothetical protein